MYGTGWMVSKTVTREGRKGWRKRMGCMDRKLQRKEKKKRELGEHLQNNLPPNLFRRKKNWNRDGEQHSTHGLGPRRQLCARGGLVPLRGPQDGGGGALEAVGGERRRGRGRRGRPDGAD